MSLDGTGAKRQSTTVKQVVLQRLKYFCKKKKNIPEKYSKHNIPKVFFFETLLQVYSCILYIYLYVYISMSYNSSDEVNAQLNFNF